MEKKIKEFEALAKGTADYLHEGLHFSARSLGYFWYHCRDLRHFMRQVSSGPFGHGLVKTYYRHLFGERPPCSLDRNEKAVYLSLKRLRQYQVSGRVIVRPRKLRRRTVLSGPIGNRMEKYLWYKERTERCSRSTLHSHRDCLSHFYVYCEQKGIFHPKDMDMPFLYGYLLSAGTPGSGAPTIARVIWALRGFLSHVHREGLTATDLSKSIPSFKKVPRPKVPLIYSAEEIERLVSRKERSSPMGKRDLAIVLLAARLGLRGSDICRLRFGELDWEGSRIVLTQHKTGRELVLPMLADVGNAIIDYLRHGRPVLDSPFVFLTERAPIVPLSGPNVVTHIVRRAFQRAGVDTKGRCSGARALRHTLASRMLGKGTPLPVISGVLGHAGTETTRFYLRIDIGSLKVCALDVPPVAAGFYGQNKGGFYERWF